MDDNENKSNTLSVLDVLVLIKSPCLYSIGILVHEDAGISGSAENICVRGIMLSVRAPAMMPAHPGEEWSTLLFPLQRQGISMPASAASLRGC